MFELNNNSVLDYLFAYRVFYYQCFEGSFAVLAAAHVS